MVLMPLKVLPTPVQMVLLAALALLAALLSNALASPHRRLAWRSSMPALPTIAKPLPSPRTLAPAITALQGPAAKSMGSAARPSVPAPRPKPAPMTSPAGTSSNLIQVDPIREIDDREAWERFQAHAMFLDARRSQEFEVGHIPGAFSVPVWEADLEDRLFQVLATRHPGPEDPIVIYCSGGDCRDSHLLAMKFLARGDYRLLVYRDGFPGWVAAGRAVEKGRP